MFRFIAPLCFALLLSACASQPVVQLYDGASRPDTQIVTLQVPSAFEILTINGEKNRAANTFFASDQKTLQLLPGQYQLALEYKALWDIDADTHEVVKSAPALLTLDTQAGDVWTLAFDAPASLSEAQALRDAFAPWAERADGERVASAPIALTPALAAPAAAAATPAAQASDAAPAPAPSSTPSASYLDMLKAQWSQASDQERREFLQWISR